jgi:hypothetical protein
MLPSSGRLSRYLLGEGAVPDPLVEIKHPDEDVAQSKTSRVRSGWSRQVPRDQPAQIAGDAQGSTDRLHAGGLPELPLHRGGSERVSSDLPDQAKTDLNGKLRASKGA